MKPPVRLIYGFLSQSIDPYNLSYPWQTSTQDGMFKMNYSIEDAVITNVKMWLKTNWGERPMRFFFGLDARRALFENEAQAKDLIETNARAQLGKYFKFLNIKELKVFTRDDDADLQDNQVRFYLKANFRNDPIKVMEISTQIEV